MNILFAAAEAAPLAHTGGLGDVIGGLPKALRAQGADVRVIMPCYDTIAPERLGVFQERARFSVQMGWRRVPCSLLAGELGGVPLYLIGNPTYFHRGYLHGYNEEAERFVFFSLAVMESVRHLGFWPEVLHAHDWHGGLLPFLLKTRYRYEPGWAQVRTVFTIHNLSYRGAFTKDEARRWLRLSDELSAKGPPPPGRPFSRPLLESLHYANEYSCMVAGIRYADWLTTVSPAYAQEIQTAAGGEGLQGLLAARASSLQGILNGVDEERFNPARLGLSLALSDTDRQQLELKLKGKQFLESVGKELLEVKQVYKQQLQHALGLQLDAQAWLVGMVSRLVEHKGLDLLLAALDEMMKAPIQLVVLGVGEARYEQQLQQAMLRYPGRMALVLQFDEELAQRIYAATDLYVMPSKTEPCGLSHLIAMRYGAVPLVRATGGLLDTVTPFDQAGGKGNGFRFDAYEPSALLAAFRQAMECLQQPSDRIRLLCNAMRTESGWHAAASAYLALYRRLLQSRL